MSEYLREYCSGELIVCFLCFGCDETGTNRFEPCLYLDSLKDQDLFYITFETILTLPG